MTATDGRTSSPEISWNIERVRPRVRRGSPNGRPWQAWLYVAPAAIMLLLFFAVPLGLAVWMSASDWQLLTGYKGLNFPANYARIASDQLFLSSVLFTLKYTAIITVVLISLSLGLALSVQESKRRFTSVLRTVYFLPAVTGLSAAALLFLGLLNPTVGPVGKTLGAVGIYIDWLGTPNMALLSTVLMMTWRFAGFYMIILLSGLQAIPAELYEAASLDGANRWRSLRSITLPLMRSNIALCLVLIITGGLVAFDQFYILTGGGPDNSTLTMVMAIFRQAFSQFDIGAAAALSIVVLIGLVVLNVVQLGIVRKNPEGGTE